MSTKPSENNGENDNGALPDAQVNSHDYIYSRIAAALRQDIREGKLPAGSRLPSADALSERFQVNKGTVRRALAELTADGLIYAVPAQGTYVSDEPPSETRRRRTTALTVGLVSQVLEGAAFGPSDAEVLTGLQDELVKRNGTLILLPAPKALSPAKLSEWIVQAHLDGIIYLEALEPAVLRRMLQAGPPAVTVNFRPRGQGVDSILVDNRGGARQAIEHLYALGHRRLLVITGPLNLSATQERIDGVREAMRAYGLPESRVTMVEGNFRRIGGFRAMAAALKARTMGTAVFCFNDEMAVGALQALHKHSTLHVPRDISVMGFDDISWAQATNPPLTTVRVDRAVMGRLAIERLIARIGGRDMAATATTVETSVVERESTTAPRGRKA
ncbi:MAG: GntR family transcriptional regulator [Planctomycetes bacterium]|nr:GntR family transcriptional regulator [Planctomycetota bacterium]